MTEQPPNTQSDLRSALEKDLGETYAFDRELGGGGMSRVFVAEERALKRLVVVKVLKGDMAEGVSFDRFRREIQLAAKLQHPHIVPLISSGEVAAKPYFTMPFIEGESLRARLTREGELPVAESLRILRHVAAALSYAHKHGVVHRDIKPDNVMLADDFALVTDFGVAKAVSESSSAVPGGSLTGLGLAIGTPAYMSPEQAVADPTVDHRADIYSWGVLAYEMLTGWPPFNGLSPQATLAAQAVQKPDDIQKKRPGLPPALSSLVMRCLEKRPSDRPQTAADVLQELDAIVTPTGGTQATLVAPPAPSKGVPRAFSIATAVIVVAIAAFLLYQRGGFTRSASSTELNSVAVLPMVNVGGDSANDYFSDGMTDELTNALGKLPGLRVASRTSAYAFKRRTDADAAQIGKALHVQALLEGTVRRAGDRLRVTAQLTNVSDGLAFWSDTYERDAKDVFRVQDDIARSIANALKLKLGTPAATVSSSSRGTENLQAYDLYLRGLYFWNRRGADNLLRAISYFEQAVAADKNFGRAYAAMASAYALLPEYTDSPPADVLDRTRSAATHALQIDSGLAQAHTALGLASVHAWDFDAAEKQYRMAIALEPRYATAHQWYGELLYQTGRVDSAVAEIRRAAELDPLAPITASALGYALDLAGRCDEGITEIKKGIELASTIALNHMVLSYCYLFKRDYPNAVREVETAARLAPDLAVEQGALAYIYGATGDRNRARAVLARLEQRARSEHVGPFSIAMAKIGLGDNEGALTALERAVNEHDIALSQFSMTRDRAWEPIRSDPRFRRILERMNLAHYVSTTP